MNNKDKPKTLEQLENDFWQDPGNVSSLISKCHNLRKKPIQDLDVEDLRILLGQNIGLKYLVPIALNIMDKEPFVEGAYYEGDLLKSVLAINKEYWNQNPNLQEKLIKLFQNNIEILKEMNISDQIKEELIEAYNKLKHFTI